MILNSYDSAGRVGAKRRIEAKRVARRAARLISIRFATQSALAPPTFAHAQPRMAILASVEQGFRRLN